MKTLPETMFVCFNSVGRYYRAGLFGIVLFLASVFVPGCPQPPVDPPIDTTQPNADAGKDRQVMAGQRVSLNARKNIGDNFIYEWSRTSGPEITLTNGNSPNANFIAQTTGTYQVQLAVRLGDLEDTDSVTIVTLPQSSDSIPVAAAGADRIVPSNVTVELDGRASFDPGGGELTYSWRQIEGPAVALSGANTARPTFTSPVVTDSVTLAFELFVQNPGGYNAVDTVTITVALGATMQHNLAVRIVGGGTVIPNQGAFNDETQVELTAAPNAGWRFSRWEGDLESLNNPASIIMNDNTFITAVFVSDGFTLQVLTAGQGSVELNPPGGIYQPLAEVTLTPVPANELWKFDRWEGDLTESENPVTITMDEDKIITAFFISTNQVSSPSFNPPSFTVFQNSLNVTISTATPGAAIYYTINEDRDPTQSDLLFTTPILLTGNTTIRARAFLEGLTPSAVTTANYLTMEVPGGVTIKAK